MATSLTTLTRAEFENAVSAGRVPVLVVFGAAWCTTCRALQPIMGQLAREFAGRALVASVDVDAQPALAARFSIVEIPQSVVFAQRQPVARWTGPATYRQLAQLLFPLVGGVESCTPPGELA